MRAAFAIGALVWAACRAPSGAPPARDAPADPWAPVIRAPPPPPDARLAIDAAVDAGHDVVIAPGSPSSGFALSLPAVLPCVTAARAHGVVFGPADDRRFAFHDRDGRELFGGAADGKRWPAAIDVASIASAKIAGPVPLTPFWFGVECDNQGGIGWSCEADRCVVHVTNATGELFDPDESRVPARCAAAAGATAPVGRCRAAITAEARRRLAELARMVASACSGGACSDAFEDVRDDLAALARAKLHHRSTVAGPFLAPRHAELDGMPHPPVGRSTFAAGAARVVMECGPDHDTDGHPLTCHLLVDTRAGTLHYVRDPIHHDLDAFTADGSVEGSRQLSGAAVRLRP